MSYWPNDVSAQPLLILCSSSESTTATHDQPSHDKLSSASPSVTEDPFVPDSEGNYPSCSIQHYFHSSIGEPRSGSLIIDASVSNVPAIWQSELGNEYKELGEALAELTELDEAADMMIERPVFEAARTIAFELMANAYPAPRVFNHGPRSVVFNWTQGFQNLYLTISADKVSALVSVPAKIQRRIDYSFSALLNPALVLKSLESVGRQESVDLISGPGRESSKSSR